MMVADTVTRVIYQKQQVYWNHIASLYEKQGMEMKWNELAMAI